METHDLSECYSKLDQSELVRILSRMIKMAFVGKKYLAVSPFDKTSRWIDSCDESLSREKVFTADCLCEVVNFLTTNAYIE